MPKPLITVLPSTRVYDLFITPDSLLDSAWPEHAYCDDIIQGRPNVDGRFHANFYQKVGLDIVVETVLQYPYNFVTEKTYRPLANARPFVVLGPVHTLSFLKSLGFLTFSSIIDEAYDDVSDPELRFNAVCKVVRDFVDRPIESVVQDIKRVESTLIHNQKNLTQLLSAQLQSLQEQISN